VGDFLTCTVGYCNAQAAAIATSTSAIFKRFTGDLYLPADIFSHLSVNWTMFPTFYWSVNWPMYRLVGPMLYTSSVKLQMKSQAWLLRLFVCLLSMKYPVMWKHQQMMFTSQNQKLTVICSLLSFWRGWIWLGKVINICDFFDLW